MNNPLTITSDKPTKYDSLNFRDYANIFTDIVLQCETPMTIGILENGGAVKQA